MRWPALPSTPSRLRPCNPQVRAPDDCILVAHLSRRALGCNFLCGRYCLSPLQAPLLQGADWGALARIQSDACAALARLRSQLGRQSDGLLLCHFSDRHLACRLESCVGSSPSSSSMCCWLRATSMHLLSAAPMLRTLEHCCSSASDAISSWSVGLPSERASANFVAAFIARTLV